MTSPSLRPGGALAGHRLLLAYLAGTVVLTGIAFVPYLGGDFVWDDVRLVQRNPSLQSARGLGRLVTTDIWDGAEGRPSVLYHPMPMATFWLQARLTGISLVGLRAGNVVVHVVCGLLLLLWLRRLNAPPWGALVAALAFLVHPSVTEPVMWLTGRHDSLAVLCCLAALLAWPARGGPRSLPRAAATALLCGLAFLCKEPYVVMPVLLLCYALWATMDDGRPLRAAIDWRLTLPVAAVAGVVLLRRALAIPTSSGQPASPVLHQLVDYGTIVWHYVVQLATLSNGRTIASYRVLPPALALVLLGAFATALGALAVAWRGGHRAAGAGLFGLLWILVTLAPHVLALPVYGVYANRYAYFPLVGLIVLATLALTPWTTRWQPRLRALGIGGALAGVAALALATAAEARAWRDEVSLFGPDLPAVWDDPAAAYHYGQAIYHRGGCAAALPAFARAAELAPGYGDAWHNLAGCLVTLGRYADAVPAATRAVNAQPKSSRRAYNLGVALVGAGRTAEGVPLLQEAVRLEPTFAPAVRALAATRHAPAGASQPATSYDDVSVAAGSTRAARSAGSSAPSSAKPTANASAAPSSRPVNAKKLSGLKGNGGR